MPEQEPATTALIQEDLAALPEMAGGLDPEQARTVLAPLDDGLRSKFKIDPKVKAGVVVTEVTAGSIAAQRRAVPRLPWREPGLAGVMSAIFTGGNSG